jgi:hypothetical protein
MAVVAFGDSRTSGDQLYNSLSAWPFMLSDRLGAAFTVNGGKGRTCFARFNVENAANNISAALSMPLSSRTDADRAGLQIVNANNNFYLFLPNGATSFGFAHTTAQQTGATFFTHSNSVLVAKPTTGGTQFFQRPDTAANWLITGVQNDWAGNKSYADANNIIFGYYSHNQNLATSSTIGADTIRVFPTSGFPLHFDYVFWTEGSHNKDCYIGVRNLSVHGGTPVTYYDATNAASSRQYYPVGAGSRSVGQNKTFEDILRHLSKYQASGFRNPGTTGQGAGTGTTGSGAVAAPTGWIGHFGADTVVVIDAYYYNTTGAGALDAPSTATIDTLVAGKRTIRDMIVAETNCFYIALMLPPCGGVDDDRLTYQVTQMKAMCAEHSNSAVVSLPDVMGYSRTTSRTNYALNNSRGDNLHESEIFQAELAGILCDVFRYSRALAG